MTGTNALMTISSDLLETGYLKNRVFSDPAPVLNLHV